MTPAALLKCVVPWPACPRCYVGDVDASAGKVGARCLSCGHVWAGFPAGAPCGGSATHVVSDQSASVLLCDAHAAMAHKLLPDARIDKMTIVRREIVL